MQLNYSFQNSRIKKVFPVQSFKCSVRNIENRDAKKKQFSKDWLNYLRCMVINSNVSSYLLVSLFVSKESISSIFNNTVEPLQRTPSGPQKNVHYREVSATQRFYSNQHFYLKYLLLSVLELSTLIVQLACSYLSWFNQRTISKVVSLYPSPPHFCLELEVTGKRVNLGRGYGLEIPARICFYGTEKVEVGNETNIKRKTIKRESKLLPQIKYNFLVEE